MSGHCNLKSLFSQVTQFIFLLRELSSETTNLLRTTITNRKWRRKLISVTKWISPFCNKICNLTIEIFYRLPQASLYLQRNGITRKVGKTIRGINLELMMMLKSYFSTDGIARTLALKRVYWRMCMIKMKVSEIFLEWISSELLPNLL